MHGDRVSKGFLAKNGTIIGYGSQSYIARSYYGGESQMNNETMIRRVIWATRRGLMELDLLLAPLTHQNLEELSDTELKDLLDFLETDDPTLLDWLKMGTRPLGDKECVWVDWIRCKNEVKYA